jgi:hypothetical protein
VAFSGPGRPEDLTMAHTGPPYIQVNFAGAQARTRCSQNLNSPVIGKTVIVTRMREPLDEFVAGDIMA